MRFRFFSAHLASWFLLTAMVGCGSEGPSESVEEQLAPTILKRGNGEAPATLDPALAEDVHTFNVLVDIYEGLVAEAADGSLIPGVAESWDISNDGLAYRFQLRSNARWSNGDQVRAVDFVNAFQRIAAPDSQSPFGFLLEPIENFADVSAGSKSKDVLGVNAIDDQTLEIRLSSPSPHMLGIFAMPIAFPVYGDAPESTQFSDPAEFVGNGPYRLAVRQLGSSILLRRNEMYWDRSSVSFDEIEYLPVINAATELNMYRAGELDITGTVPTESFASLREEFPSELRVAPALALYYIAYDLTEAPFDNVQLRQALSMAIDREALVDLLGRGEQTAYGIVPPGVANHVGANYDWRDLNSADREQRARDVLIEAGYDDTNPLKFKFTYDAGDIHEFVALAVSSMWRDTLGIDVELEKKEWQLFLAGRDDRPSWQAMRFSWFGDYNDASTFTNIFRSDSEQNLPRYSNMEYDEKLNQAAMETRVETRMNLMTQAEKTLIDDYPIAPLYFFVNKHMVKPHVAGFQNSILDRHPSKYLSLVER